RIAELMIGAELAKIERHKGRAAGAVRLAVQGLSVTSGEPFGVDLEEISFEARAGEILGSAGVAGNGQSELMPAPPGETVVPPALAVCLDSQAIGGLPPPERRRNGLCALPEERNGHAAVASFSLAENTLLTARERKQLSVRGVIKQGAMRDYARK